MVHRKLREAHLSVKQTYSIYDYRYMKVEWSAKYIITFNAVEFR